MKLYVYAAIFGVMLATGTSAIMGLVPSGIALPLPQSRASDTGLNVIMVMWDGIRIDEFLGQADPARASGADAPLLPYFWQTLAPTGSVYGDIRHNEVMTVANSALISLPAYESIFAGSTQPCQNNDCDRTGRETFPERILSDLSLPRRRVATMASWEGLMFAVESHPGRTFVNAGAQDVHEANDAEEQALNATQKTDIPPWPDCRYDKYTWRQAMRYLDRERPRYMFISLDDADGWGHRGVYKNYLQAIRDYNQWLSDLVSKLAEMGAYGRDTCLLVTTDHGRGTGDQWGTHSNGTPYAGLVLMYAGCPLAPSRVAFKPPGLLTTHLNIRPTVEEIFGLSPYRCALCGTSLVDAISPVSSQSAN